MAELAETAIRARKVCETCKCCSDEPKPKRAAPIADPGPLGLAGFAATTFILSAHNAGWAPDLAWVGPALFYGGLSQLLAGMWEFRNNNVFGATAFTTYGGFWMALASFVILVLTGNTPGSLDVNDAVGWFLVAFFIFTTYMLITSIATTLALFSVFLTLDMAFLCLFIGRFVGNSAGVGGTAVGGYIGVVCAVLAWYNSGGILINKVVNYPLVPLGGPLFDVQAYIAKLKLAREVGHGKEDTTAAPLVAGEGNV